MRPVHLYATVTPRQRRQLLDAVHGRWRVAVRIIMILLSTQGFTPTQIAGLLGYDPHTVRRWITRWHTEGINGLPDRPRPGRPRLGSPHLGERIRTLLSQPKAWTTAAVWRELGRPAISLCTMYQRIREYASWRRPRLVAKSAPDHDEVVAGVRRQVADLPSGSVVLAEDETHLDWLARVRATWIPHGIRHLVPTPGSNQRRSLFGALNVATGTWHYRITANKVVSTVFCSFLEQVLTAYPDAPVVAVVCDNDTTHTSGITARWLDKHSRLWLITGARYSPQDNPVERIWAALKRAIANTAPVTMTDRVRQARAFFRHHSPDQMLATAAPWSSPWLPEGYEQDFKRAA